MEVHKTRSLSEHSKHRCHASRYGLLYTYPTSIICHIKKLLTFAMLVGCATLAFTQEEVRSRLAILPLAGGIGGEGEAIAAILLERQEILSAFIVVPLAGEAVAVAAEHRLQMGAFTDSDLVAELGRMLGADYVLSGSLRRLGNRNLVVVTVVCVYTLQLVAGYYRTYRNIHEIRGLLPSIAGSLVDATLARPVMGSLPTLAIAPLGLTVDPAAISGEQPQDADAHGAAVHDMETLAQILAIEIANSGEYAVLPRASVMQSALRAWEARIADERAAALDLLLGVILGILDEEEDAYLGEVVAAVTEVGRAAAAEYVLSVETRSLEGMTIFAAQILNTDEAVPIAGADRGHRHIREGVNQVAEIAVLLTDPDGAAERLAAPSHSRRQTAMFGDPARFWSVGLFAGTSFADPLAIATLQGTVAPLPFSFIRLGLDAGFVSGMEGAGYYSIYPFAHLAFFMPFDLTPIPLWGGGMYMGVGGGFLLARYAFPDNLNEYIRMPLVDFTAGVNIANMVGVSYTLRTDFESFNGKLSVGFTHRFWIRRR